MISVNSKSKYFSIHFSIKMFDKLYKLKNSLTENKY